MVGENFDFHSPQMPGNALKIVHHGWIKFWTFIHLKCLEMHLKLSTMFGENFGLSFTSNALKISKFQTTYAEILCYFMLQLKCYAISGCFMLYHEFYAKKMLCQVRGMHTYILHTIGKEIEH